MSEIINAKDTGLRGVLVADTYISLIDGVKGELSYRGYDIHDLSEYSTNEEVSYLLLNGNLPTPYELEQFTKILADERTVPTEISSFLEKLPKSAVDRYLGLMETVYSKKLSQLLGYSSDSAGGLMTTEYLFFSKDTTIEAALQLIKERSFKVEPPQFVYIVDENNHLVGSTNFRRMMLANPADSIQKTAFPRTYPVHLDSSVKEIAYLMEKYKYYTIPVVDDQNVLQGIVTVDDVLSQVVAIAWRRFNRIKAKITV